MKNLNEVKLIGYVGKDPECMTTNTGINLATFSIATTKKWKDQDGKEHEQTQWHRCVAWRKLADIVKQYVHKGDPLFISGEINYEEYEKEGVKKFSTKIVIDDLIMLGKKEAAQPEIPPTPAWFTNEQKTVPAPAPVSAPVFTQDLPF